MGCLTKRDCSRVLKKFHKDLNKGGLLFLAVQEGEGEKPVYWPLAKEEIFNNFYSKEEIEKELNSAGFDVIFSAKYHPLKNDLQNDKLVIIAKRRY